MDTAEVICRAVNYYDSADLEVEIYYTRLETDEEMERRIAEEESRIRREEDQERRELDRLLKKFGK